MTILFWGRDKLEKKGEVFSLLLGKRLDFEKDKPKWLSALRWRNAWDGVGSKLVQKRESMLKINEILMLRVIDVQL